MAGERKKAKGVKPPIKPKSPPQALEPQTRQLEPGVAQSALDPYLSSHERIAALPKVGEHLTADRVQGIFAHLHFLSVHELRARERLPNISILEQQAIRLLLKTMRELPNQEIFDLDAKGKKQFNPDGTVKMKFNGLNKDQLQNERQALDAIKYLHERAFGKPKITIEHTGNAPVSTTHLHLDAVLDAMDNLPPHIIDVVAIEETETKKEK